MESSPKALAKKKELSYDEALAVAQYYDGKIKQAAQLRSPEVKDKTSELVVETFVRGGVTGFFGSFVAAIPFAVQGDLFMSVSMFVVMIASTAPLFMSDGDNARAHKITAIARYKKYSKYKREAFFNKQLFEIGEEDYSKAIAKILPKAQLALNTINKYLVDEEIVYNDTAGREGFRVKAKPLENLDQWGKLSLKSPNASTSRVLESSSSNNKKAISQ